jgi:carbamoyl-phosphate synthase large subunit
VLLTCAGQKGYVLRALETSARAGRIVAVDCDPDAPVRSAARFFEPVPPLQRADEYVEALLDVAARYEIDCLVPLNDLDLGVLAQARAVFARRGVAVLGASPAVVEAMRDKLAAAAWLAEEDLPAPRTWPAELPPPGLPGPGRPLVAKARFGQGSEGLRVCTTPEDLRRLDAGAVLQERLAGPEYNLDILRSAEGVIAVVGKRKLEMRYGSTHAAELVDDPELVALGVRLGEALTFVGSIDVDVMRSDRATEIIDVNPRLGGGFPFTALFFPEYVDALLAIGLGETPEPLFGLQPKAGRAVRELAYRLHPPMAAPRRARGRRKSP